MDRWRALTALAAVIFTVHAMHYWPIWIDDAYITFRYAENVRAGIGMVYNAGERVEGLTNLGWALLLTPFAGGDLLFWSKLFGLGFGLGTVVLVGEWARTEVLPLSATGLTLAILVVFPWLPSYSMYGLETDAAAFFMTLAWTRHGVEADGRSRVPLAALGMGLAPWMRPDGALAAILLGGWHLLRRGPKLTRSALVATLIVLVCAGTLVLVKLHWFGEIVPNTAATKLRNWPPVRGLSYLDTFFSWPSPVLSFVCAAGALWGVLRVVRREDRALPGLFATIGLVAAVVQNGDFMQNFRFLVPTWPAMAAAVGVLVADLSRLHRHAPLLASLAALPFFAPVLPVLQGDRLLAAGYADSVQAKTAPWLFPWVGVEAPTLYTHRFTFPSAWSIVHRTETTPLAYVNIGLLGFTSRGPVLDMLGLTDPIMGRRFSPEDSATAWSHVQDHSVYVMLDLPDGEWSRYRTRLAEGGWSAVDGCPPFWIFARPETLSAAMTPSRQALLARLDYAFARAWRNPALLVGIAHELAWSPGDPDLFAAWEARIREHVTPPMLRQLRCSAGLDGCTYRPTCDTGRNRLDITSIRDPADWPTATGREPKRRAHKRAEEMGLERVED
ncbi:MAG: hypothetical protein EXR71_10905 [Myxococcales bacterium]|nr:hypothetical protein [Myxococcales bacterium]